MANFCYSLPAVGFGCWLLLVLAVGLVVGCWFLLNASDQGI